MSQTDISLRSLILFMYKTEINLSYFRFSSNKIGKVILFLHRTHSFIVLLFTKLTLECLVYIRLCSARIKCADHLRIKSFFFYIYQINVSFHLSLPRRAPTNSVSRILTCTSHPQTIYTNFARPLFTSALDNSHLW